MSEHQWVSLIAMLGWLILAASALASFRFDWNRDLRMGLVWLAIFAGIFLAFRLGQSL